MEKTFYHTINWRAEEEKYSSKILFTLLSGFETTLQLGEDGDSIVWPKQAFASACKFQKL